MATGMIYTFRHGFSPARADGRTIDPQRVGERLERIRRESDGVLDAVDVVVDARQATSPLHHCFEWDDKRAAHEHRVDQAKQLIKAVTVVVPDGDTPLPAFTAAATDARDGRPKFVRRDKAPAFTMPVKTRADQLQEAYRELRRIRTRFAMLDELGPILRAIDEELAELERSGVLSERSSEDTHEEQETQR
jgi:hypothetical protein